MHGTRTPTAPVNWRRNLFAVTAASFMGFTGFTLVMPFLPLFIRQLGVTDVSEIALWTGLSLGVTPALTAIMSPAWGRLADRLGRKLMVARALLSFVVVMTLMGFVTAAWQVFALRAIQGFFAGYGALALTMAAESVPRERMALGIGTVQTAQRLGPALGPVMGGALAQWVGLRHAFFFTAGFYAIGFLIVVFLYDERARSAGEGGDQEGGAITFRDILAFENFILLMLVVFGIQFVDRSFGPILPLFIEQLGAPHAQVPLLSGLVFSITALTGAVGHHFCGRLLETMSARQVIVWASAVAALGAVGFASAPGVGLMYGAAVCFGLGVGAATTAAYTAAGHTIPAGAHGAGFGLLTGSSLAGLAISPMVAGLLAATSMRAVFVVDVVLLAALGVAVYRVMHDAGGARPR